MATYDLTANAAFAGDHAPWGTTGNGFGNFYVAKLHCDIDKMNEDPLTLAAITDGDVINLWDIPIGTRIFSVFMNVVHPATATTCTVSVSTGTEAEWMAATALDAAGTVAGTGAAAVAGLIGGELFTSATSLDLYIHVAAATGAIFDIYVMACSVNY